MSPDPFTLRVTALNKQPLRANGDHVLYWMIANRRAHWNWSLDRAVHWAKTLNKPLVVLEALRTDYQWASDRLHAFVIQGMADNADAFAAAGITYHAYVEPNTGAGKGLLRAWAKNACVVITDEFPCFFLPHMTAAAAVQVPVLMEQVDGNGIVPLRASATWFLTAYSFRRFLQKQLPLFLGQTPAADPCAGCSILTGAVIPKAISKQWPATDVRRLARDDTAMTAYLRSLPIDHSVGPVATRGGSGAARERSAHFIDKNLVRYGNKRSDAADDASSGLSAYLHFGHLSAHHLVVDILTHEQWSPARLATSSNGKREGWWGVSASAESFLDEIITWRELGYSYSFHRPSDYDRYESLPAWARASLEQHADDQRAHCYTLAQFAAGQTHDPLWNAAQGQLRREGRIHNYLRMLWGKKILEWTTDAREAAAVMIELNNRFALDGRNPNSYSGIFWCLGRYDRPWAPTRNIFGVIRYMSSDNTARKMRVKDYIAEYA